MRNLLVMGIFFLGAMCSRSNASSIPITFSLTDGTASVVGATDTSLTLSRHFDATVMSSAGDAGFNPATYTDLNVGEFDTGYLQGTFEFQFGNGDTLTGNMFEDASAIFQNGYGPFTLDLTFTGGSGLFATASGFASATGFVDGDTDRGTASGSGVVDTSPVPEPTSVAVLLGGLGLILVGRRRERIGRVLAALPIVACATVAHADYLYSTRYDGTVTQTNTVTHQSNTYVSGLGGVGGLVFDATGDLFLSDYPNSTIVKVAPNGTQTTFATNVQNPAGLTIDSAGNLYVASYVGGSTETSGVGEIERFTPSGQASVFATGLDGPLDPKFGPDGNLYVSNYSGTVDRITPGGSVSVFASGIAGPVGLAFDKQGNLYVSTDVGDLGGNYGDSDRKIFRFAPDGTESVFASAAPYDTDGLAFDSLGNLYAGHDGDGGISVFAPDGSMTTFALSEPDVTTSFLAIGPVPEPASALILTVAGLALLGRRRSRRVSAS